MSAINQTDLSLLLLGAGASSLAFRFIALLAFRRSNDALLMLQRFMPMVIILALLSFLCLRQDFSASAHYGLSFLAAFAVAILVRYVSKNGIAAIIISTAFYVLAQQYLAS